MATISACNEYSSVELVRPSARRLGKNQTTRDPPTPTPTDEITLQTAEESGARESKVDTSEKNPTNEQKTESVVRSPLVN